MQEKERFEEHHNTEDARPEKYVGHDINKETTEMSLEQQNQSAISDASQEMSSSGAAGKDSARSEVSEKVKKIKDFIISLKREIDEKDKKIKEYEELIKRIAADFDNYKKKVNKEKVEYVRFATKDLVLDLLPVIDNFDRAVEMINSANIDGTAKDLFVGIQLIHKELLNVLMKYGVVKVDVEGKILDPNISEVIEVEEVEVQNEEDKDIVLKEYQKAYKMYDQVIRSAKVKVQKRRKKLENKSQDEKETGSGGVSSSS